MWWTYSVTSQITWFCKHTLVQMRQKIKPILIHHYMFTFNSLLSFSLSLALSHTHTHCEVMPGNNKEYWSVVISAQKQLCNQLSRPWATVMDRESIVCVCVCVFRLFQCDHVSPCNGEVWHRSTVLLISINRLISFYSPPFLSEWCHLSRKAWRGWTSRTDWKLWLWSWGKAIITTTLHLSITV